MTDKDKNLAAALSNLDETQIVSLQDLEELERLQIAGAGKNAPMAHSRKAVPQSALLGLAAALVLTAILTAAYLHFQAPPILGHAAVAGGR